MVVDINLIISDKLAKLEREIKELQQTCALYGIDASRRAHDLQHVVEAIEDARAIAH